MKKSSKSRFLEKVKVTNLHWFWAGSSSKFYGCFYLNGKYTNASRAAYAIFVGPIPPGLEVLHTCDIPNCVNPEHLFLGTQSDNIKDMYAKGRGVDNHGSNNGMSGKFNEDSPSHKLTWGMVRQIRSLYSTGEWTQTQLGIKFGVTHTLISYIVNNKVWRE